jgi:hypothetical protein
MSRCIRIRIWPPLLALLSILSAPSLAQELEPRFLANLPVGTNFVVMAYGYSRGNILLDPSIPIEDLDARIHSIIGAYVRSVNLFGMSGKIDAIVPFAGGDWSGRLEGEYRERAATGLGDPRLRVSVNIVGAPALTKGEFAEFQQRTIFGAGLQVFLPAGQYDSSKLINLGANRWTLRSQIGVSQALGAWIVEASGGLWLFTTNSEFLTDNELKQRPLLTAKLHGIRSLRGGRWLALSVGYGAGGRTLINGIERDTYISTFRFALTLAAPLSAQHTLKLVLVSGARLKRGPDFDGVALSYQYRW